MNELERALMELEVEWPATPDLAAAVRLRIVAPAPRRSVLAGWRRRLAVAAAALVVLGGGTLAASPAARSTVGRWLGLESVEIHRGTPRATPVKPSRLGETIGLGQPVTLDQARRRAGVAVLVPRRLGGPDAVYLGRVTDGSQRSVSLIYAPRPGLPPSRVTGVALLVQTFRATMGPMLEKTVGMGGRVEYVTVAGRPGYWVSGKPHGFAYATQSGGGFEPQRLADHTLLVETKGLLLRVEGHIGRARAVEIAESALVVPSGRGH